jgi:DNA-binding NarL/FixJ family response regulator
MTPIQLLLVDDHLLFREGLRRLLTSDDNFEVVSDCGTVAEACAVVERCAIDVILLDFDLAGTPASQCILALRRAGYDGRILLVTAGVTADESTTALKLGASGIFLKHNSPGMLAQAIRLVAGGATWVDPRAMQLMSNRVEPPTDTSGRELLTERERGVLEAVFEGLTNKEIGVRVGASESAVKATLQQLFHKTGVRTRSQLVRIALERSLAMAPVRSESCDVARRTAGQKIGRAGPEDGWRA